MIVANAALAWQVHGGEYSSILPVVTFLPDGSPLLAGSQFTRRNGEDFFAVKLDAADGTELWRWTVRMCSQTIFAATARVDSHGERWARYRGWLREVSKDHDNIA